MAHQFRKAFPSDASRIWEILQQAILKRKEEGSNQWQDGYPNSEVIKKDISKEIGYVLIINNANQGLKMDADYQSIISCFLRNFSL